MGRQSGRPHPFPPDPACAGCRRPGYRPGRRRHHQLFAGTLTDGQRHDLDLLTKIRPEYPDHLRSGRERAARPTRQVQITIPGLALDPPAPAPADPVIGNPADRQVAVQILQAQLWAGNAGDERAIKSLRSAAVRTSSARLRQAIGTRASDIADRLIFAGPGNMAVRTSDGLAAGTPPSCSMIPIRRRTRARSRQGSQPSTRTAPWAGGARPSGTSIVEVFPAPVGAQQCEELPAAYREGDPPDRIKAPAARAAVAPPQVPDRDNAVVVPASIPPGQRARRCPPSPVPVTSARTAHDKPHSPPGRRTKPLFPAGPPHHDRENAGTRSAEMARSAGMDGQAEPSPDAATATSATPARGIANGSPLPGRRRPPIPSTGS